VPPRGRKANKMNIQDVKEMFREHIRTTNNGYEGADHIQKLANDLGYELWFDFSRRNPDGTPILDPNGDIRKPDHGNVVACPLKRGKNV
jgi:hypothetical protein